MKKIFNFGLGTLALLTLVACNSNNEEAVSIAPDKGKPVDEIVFKKVVKSQYDKLVEEDITIKKDDIFTDMFRKISDCHFSRAASYSTLKEKEIDVKSSSSTGLEMTAYTKSKESNSIYYPSSEHLTSDHTKRIGIVDNSDYRKETNNQDSSKNFEKKSSYYAEAVGEGVGNYYYLPGSVLGGSPDFVNDYYHYENYTHIIDNEVENYFYSIVDAYEYNKEELKSIQDFGEKCDYDLDKDTFTTLGYFSQSIHKSESLISELKKYREYSFELTDKYIILKLTQTAVFYDEDYPFADNTKALEIIKASHDRGDYLKATTYIEYNHNNLSITDSNEAWIDNVYEVYSYCEDNYSYDDKYTDESSNEVVQQKVKKMHKNEIVYYSDVDYDSIREEIKQKCIANAPKDNVLIIEHKKPEEK